MPFNEVLGDLETIILMACNPTPTWMETVVMPPFQPNDYLYKTHKHEHPEHLRENWHLYSWAVREVMSSHSKL